MRISAFCHFYGQKSECDVIFMDSTRLLVIQNSAIRNMISTTCKMHHAHIVMQNIIIFSFLITGRSRHHAKIITFFLGAQRCDTIVFTHLVYVTKPFTARSQLFKTAFGVIPRCFACCAACQSVNRQHFALSIVMILSNQT